MVYDCFRDHICQFCHSTDLVNWKWIQDSQTQPYYSPKHGTVILISKKELKKMKKLLRGREKQKQQAHQSRYLDFFSIWIISVNFRCFLIKCIDKIKKSLVVSFFIPTFAK